MLIFGIILILAIVSAADFYVIPVKKRNYAPVPKTGQTTSYATGDDGDLEKGVAWPIPRFTINADNTVTDNLTGLIWLRDANCLGSNYPGFDNDGIADGLVTWQHALDFVAGINDGTYPNCGAGHTDWRLPNIRELQTLLHHGFVYYSIPNTDGTGNCTDNGDPFFGLGIEISHRWSSTAFDTTQRWSVLFYYRDIYRVPGTSSSGVWPVRGGPR